MESESVCDEQCGAAEHLSMLKNVKEKLVQQKAESSTSEKVSDKQAEIEAEISQINMQMRWLETEVSRPASQRLYKDLVTPREVLSCATNLINLYRPPPLDNNNDLRGHTGYTLQVVRYLESNRGQKMGVGFTLTPINGGHAGDKCQIATLPWKREMGSWPPKNWAFLIAIITKRCGWYPLISIYTSYKLQDCPVEDFDRRVYECYADIIRGDRYKDVDSSISTLSMLFARFMDVDRTNDLALCFDTRLWRVACDLGLEVEDYSSRPGLTYLVGDSEIVVEGGLDRLRWEGVEAYIKSRLASSKVHPDLSNEDADKHKIFLWEVLQTQRITAVMTNDSLIDCWKEYTRYAESKLGKKLRKIASTFDMPVPALATEHVRLRCDYCKKAEGEAVGNDGKLGAKLSTCACNPHGHPYYCNSTCQKADWPNHKEFCVKPKSKKKQDGDHNDHKKKKKKDKKKKKK